MRSKMRLPCSLSIVALAVSACAPAASIRPGQQAAGPEGQCFPASYARSYTRVAPDTINVEAGVRGIYQMELLPGCEDLDWASDVAFRGRSGASFVCSARDAELLLGRTVRPQTCLFHGMRQLEAADIAALQPGHRRVFRPWRPEPFRPHGIFRRGDERPPMDPPPLPPPPATP